MNNVVKTTTHVNAFPRSFFTYGCFAVHHDTMAWHLDNILSRPQRQVMANMHQANPLAAVSAAVYRGVYHVQ